MISTNPRMCNCHSYNLDRPEMEDKTAPLLLYPPAHLLPIKSKRGISIDFCIGRVVQNLWYQNIVTLGCCCGHGKIMPSIGLEDNVSLDYIDYARALIATIDDRQFELCSWIDDDGKKLYASHDYGHLALYDSLERDL